MSYTKGPWVTDTDEKSSQAFPGGRTCVWDIEKWVCVAQCATHNHVENAALIAAAPDLVEALEMILNETNAGLWDCLPVEKAKQALTKAKGGQV